MTNEMIISIMAIVTAYVAYLKVFKLVPTKYLPLIALFIATVFVLVPERIYTVMVTVSMIGLGATGFYHTTQNKDGAKK